jgi:hypothetical protein
VTWNSPLPSALTVYRSRCSSPGFRPNTSFLPSGDQIGSKHPICRRISDQAAGGTGHRELAQAAAVGMDDPHRTVVVAVGVVGREGDLVPLRRPAAGAEAKVHPVGEDPAQAGAVEPDREEAVEIVVRLRDQQELAVRRVVARSVAAVRIRGDPLQVAAVGCTHGVDAVEVRVGLSVALAGESSAVRRPNAAEEEQTGVVRVRQPEVAGFSRVGIEGSLAEIGEELNERAIRRPLAHLGVVRDQRLVRAVGVDGVDVLLIGADGFAVGDDLAVGAARSCRRSRRGPPTR